MDWIKIKIATSKKGIDIVSALFEEAGISSLEIEDNEEFLEVLEQTKPQWDFVEDSLYEEKSKACSVSGYVTNTPEGKKTLEFIKNKINGRFEIFITVIDEEDWAENWKKYFKPIPVGKNILICPVWEEIPEEYKSRTVFKIDPGMSFGTGTHETTRLCVAALEKYITPGGSVLDLGCGSGILSIIAMMTEASFAVAVDIDENCVRIAQENARINDVPLENYKVYAGNVLTDEKLRTKISAGLSDTARRVPTKQKYNLVLMNIIPDVIIPLLPFVKNLLASDGFVVMSGIIGKYLNDIENAVKSCGMNIVEKTSENDWQCVVAGM